MSNFFKFEGFFYFNFRLLIFKASKMRVYRFLSYHKCLLSGSFDIFLIILPMDLDDVFCYGSNESYDMLGDVMKFKSKQRNFIILIKHCFGTNNLLLEIWKAVIIKCEMFSIFRGQVQSSNRLNDHFNSEEIKTDPMKKKMDRTRIMLKIVMISNVYKTKCPFSDGKVNFITLFDWWTNWEIALNIRAELFSKTD